VFSKFPKNREFYSTIKSFYKKRKSEILDIILFGSAIKGKEKPRDLDILLLFKNKEDLDIAYELRKKLEKFCAEVHVTTKMYTGLFDKNFRARTVFLGEGYSLVRKEFISKGLGYTNISLFKYELKGFSQSKRMQLQYAFYGRDKKSGISKELKLRKFADTIFFCPVKNAEKLREFFEQWNIKFEQFQILIPEQAL
jgi:predicted nucleotidyltransferase